MMKPTPNGPMFKSREEILAECATVGVTPETPLVLYCFKGARASNTFVALNEAGVENVTLYFGFWNEWSRDPSLPIETGPPYKVSPAAGVAAWGSRPMCPSAGYQAIRATFYCSVLPNGWPSPACSATGTMMSA